MYERMGVFRVAEVLRRLFRDGRMRIQRGPGARSLYLLEKWQPLRYGPRDRLTAYMRTFNYGKAPRPAGAPNQARSGSALPRERCGAPFVAFTGLRGLPDAPNRHILAMQPRPSGESRFR